MCATRVFWIMRLRAPATEHDDDEDGRVLFKSTKNGKKPRENFR